MGMNEKEKKRKKNKQTGKWKREKVKGNVLALYIGTYEFNKNLSFNLRILIIQAFSQVFNR